MAGGHYHNENIKNYPKTIQGETYTDVSVIGRIRDYRPGGPDRHYLYERVDHRAWRRASIREALRRGLIEKDPGDAP